MSDPIANIGAQVDGGELAAVDEVTNVPVTATQEECRVGDGVETRQWPRSHRSSRIIRGMTTDHGFPQVTIHRAYHKAGRPIHSVRGDEGWQLRWGPDVSCAPLARAILFDLYGTKITKRYYPEFAARFLSGILSKQFEIPVALIDQWLHDQIEPHTEIIRRGEDTAI